MEIQELKKTMKLNKNALKSINSTINQQQKKSVNSKMGNLKISSQRIKRNRKPKK